MRGFWHTVDAVIACILMMGFILTIGSQAVVPPEDLGEKAYSVLKGLDDQGVLRGYAAAMDADGLDSRVGIYSHNHSVRICDNAGSCTGTIPTAINVHSGNYLVAGNQSYQPRTVKLFIW